MRVRYTRTALEEIEGIFSYIAKDNPQAAAEVVAVFEKAVTRLANYPQSAVETDIAGVRAVLALPHPYLIFYSIESETLVIRNVRHAARRRPGPR